MKKLISIAFCEMLPEPLWSALTEVSLLFQILCSTMLDVNKVQELEGSVATILCNLKKIILPAFFDLMEHLIVHPSYKAHMEGPWNTSGCTHLRGGIPEADGGSSALAHGRGP
ncbi:UNVERIFIED_CONTAM: hypothetical protein Sradi_4352900 [Sesamum radiatum]|uniref:DUF4218 domain-containing protein n=1 Tax=Sesamum radiatum TaxID=300843 RepID=A0AAW2NRS6_SESRA